MNQDVSYISTRLLKWSDFVCWSRYHDCILEPLQRKLQIIYTRKGSESVLVYKCTLLDTSVLPTLLYVLLRCGLLLL